MRYLILCLMLTACAEPGGTAQPVSHDSVPTGSQNLGASAYESPEYCFLIPGQAAP